MHQAKKILEFKPPSRSSVLDAQDVLELYSIKWIYIVNEAMSDEEKILIESLLEEYGDRLSGEDRQIMFQSIVKKSGR